MSLSDKIGTFVYHGDEGTSGYCDAIIVGNVKEFIKLIIDDIRSRAATKAADMVEIIIKKRAGDKLT